MPAADTEIAFGRDAALVEAAIREAGALALAYFHASPKSWDKSDRSPVSEADHAVDRLLRARLTGLRPDYGWLSEESGDGNDRIARRRAWIVDPIDGTRAFLRGRTEWVVSIALVEDGRPVIGFLYNPGREELFAAVAGQGATLNGEPIAVATRCEVAGARVLTNPTPLSGPHWRQPWPEMEVHRFNSLAYRVALVAAGRFDAAMSFGRTHEWDVAAAELIIGEAGGTLSDVTGTAISYNRPQPALDGTIAANPMLHCRLVDFIKRNAAVGAAARRRREV